MNGKPVNCHHHLPASYSFIRMCAAANGFHAQVRQNNPAPSIHQRVAQDHFAPCRILAKNTQITHLKMLPESLEELSTGG